MKLLDLSKVILRKQKAAKQISSTDYPDKITVDRDFVNKLRTIAGYTDSTKSKEQGSGGWEYEMSVIYLVDKFYFTKPVSGDYSSVQSKHSIGYKPIYSNDNTKVNFEIDLSGKTQKSPTYKVQDLQKELLFGFIATFHTHPKYFHDRNTFQYTFYSGADIVSLLNGRAFCSGLIAGDYVWLACKTKHSTMIPNEYLSRATQLEFESGNDAVAKFVKENLKQFGIVFYYGLLSGGGFKRV